MDRLVARPTSLDNDLCERLICVFIEVFGS